MQSMDTGGRDPSEYHPDIVDAFVDTVTKFDMERKKEVVFGDIPKELFNQDLISEIGLTYFEQKDLEKGKQVKHFKAELMVYSKNNPSPTSFVFVMPDELLKLPINHTVAITGEQNPVEAFKKFRPIREFMLKNKPESFTLE